MRVSVPGDKSISQRALILAALGGGESRISGLLASGDAASTAAALRQLGAEVPSLSTDGGEVRIRGVGLSGLSEPADSLDLGNSGTGARLLLGVLAGSGVGATITGDESLRARPMRRVTEPLGLMGAGFAFPEEEGRLPVRVTGRRPLRPIVWESPVASAQVKSAILLAGLTGSASVSVSEPRPSRDHTERLLRHLGAAVVGEEREGRWSVTLSAPPEEIPPLELEVPGDVSSASFLLALAAMGGAREPLTVEGVGLNPTRTAFLAVLRRMGAEVAVVEEGTSAGEPVGSVSVEPAELAGTVVEGEEIPSLIDELPLVAVLGARASGVTEIRDAGELRHKESDRISALVENLRALGASVEERPDGLSVQGSHEPLQGVARVMGDHRIAMAFGVLARAPGNELRVDDPGAADVSFPGFWSLLDRVAGASRP